MQTDNKVIHTFHLFTLYMDLELHKCIWNIETANIDGHTKSTHIPPVPIVQFVFWVVNQNGSHTWLFEQFKVQKSERYFFSTQNIIATQTTRTAFIRKCLATRSMPLPSHMQCILRDIEVFLFSFLRLFLLLIQLLFSLWYYVCVYSVHCAFMYICGWHRWNLPTFLVPLEHVVMSVGWFFSSLHLMFVALSIPRLNCGFSLGFCFDSCVCVFFAEFFVVFHHFELSYSRMQFNALFPFLPLSTFNV